MYYQTLRKKIKKKKAIIAVVGLGYVGMPLLAQFYKKDFNTIGIDIDKKKINKLKNNKINSIYFKNLFKKNKFKNLSLTNDFSYAKNSDVIILCLPTPLKKNKSPDISYIKQALLKLGPYLKKGQALSLESTTYPETTEEILLPFLKKLKFNVSKDFFLIYSPERESPVFEKNKNKFTLFNTPKICSGYSSNCLNIGSDLYSQVVKTVVRTDSTKKAELAKMIENIYRAVNIGLVNELKMLSQKMKINIHQVIDLAGTKPFGFTKFLPGPGLGGHCIPIDPYYLSWRAKKYKFDTKFIRLAGEINQKVTNWTINNVIKIIKKKKIDLKQCKILLLGVAYKADIDDLRESPALKIISNFKKRKIKFDYCDPYIDNIENLNLKSVKLNYQKFKLYDCVVLLTDHSIFNKKKLINHSKLIIDTRGYLKNFNQNKLFHL